MSKDYACATDSKHIGTRNNKEQGNMKAFCPTLCTAVAKAHHGSVTTLYALCAWTRFTIYGLLRSKMGGAVPSRFFDLLDSMISDLK